MLAHSLREEGGTKGKGSRYRNSLEISRPWVELRVCTCPPLGVYFGGVSSCPWLTHLCISGTHFFFTATLFHSHFHCCGLWKSEFEKISSVYSFCSGFLFPGEEASLLPSRNRFYSGIETKTLKYKLIKARQFTGKVSVCTEQVGYWIVPSRWMLGIRREPQGRVFFPDFFFKIASSSL